MARWKQIVFSDWSIILTVSVLLFVFWDGLVFTAETSEHAGRLTLSYGFVPVAVAAALFLRRKWSWGAFGYYTFVIALIKMTVTMTVYLWVIPGGQRAQSKEIESVVPDTEIVGYTQTTVGDGAQVAGELRIPGGFDFLGSDWIVALSDIRRGRAGLPQTQRVAISDAQITPRALSVTVGDTMVVANQEQEFHTFSLIDAVGQIFQLPLPPGRTASRVIVRPGFFESRCRHGHADERIAVYAFAHPYHAVLDDGQRFSIGSIPAGQYQLALWRVDHTKQRTLEEGREPDAVFDLSLQPGEDRNVVWNVDAKRQITGE